MSLELSCPREGFSPFFRPILVTRGIREAFLGSSYTQNAECFCGLIEKSRNLVILPLLKLFGWGVGAEQIEALLNPAKSGNPS